ncbi:3-phosphate dehydrogenase, mitochondrial [Seminavis robusta]|uniref:Glycerol-3-phosphate dehydrogenase n=1 Tax=Seminavis robusta TaxID=568900 RepID=A0A9N8HN54_9STRA|nr:3-phosphate dehydrogenase, mitochondrial [Seminavis robusta]|eukprot:Sro1180_g249740.1 3-phosphate dehydrogenase, mitochondrial (636) ;mRNA; r:19863-22031
MLRIASLRYTVTSTASASRWTRVRVFSSTALNNTPDRDPGLALTSVLSNPKEVNGPTSKIPSRAEQIRRLQQHSADINNKQEYDIVVVGGGATGAGIALDAAMRGLQVACIERGDFASETSSRSTKLIWAGIKYMATASAALLSKRLFTNPVATIQDFYGEMAMVLECHQERKFMTAKQPHLCSWIPIAVPFTKWHVSPPPFGHWLFGFFPILSPMVMKFYDALSLFQCPPSYIMLPKKAKEVFPQMAHEDILYASVFFEAIHNDARTNLAIALSAAEHGASIVNYVEMESVIQDGTKKVVGVNAVDRMTGQQLALKAKRVVFAGGPFTDDLRRMETGEATKPAVQGGAGTHVVLPSYYCSSQMGLLDYNTSDGRFLFILPWENHTLIGTTDGKSSAHTLPGPPEDEVDWILNECKTYLSNDLEVRRSDVNCAWQGWRPLAVDPHAPPGAPVSRDHVISENEETGIIFIAGGKWTTWRVMAQQIVDRVVGKSGPKCSTLDAKLFGHDGYEDNLKIKLIQKHGMPEHVAEHLARTYGGQAWDLCGISKPTPIVAGYPYIEAEVIYACREYACTVEDILSRRTRLAFLNKEAALQAIPKVAELMANELGWTKEVTAQQIEAATKYAESYAGPDRAER